MDLSIINKYKKLFMVPEFVLSIILNYIFRAAF